MKIVIPEDKQPVKQWENGDIKYAMKYIYVANAPEVVKIIILPKFEPASFSEINVPPTECKTKVAVYRMIEEPNCEGIATYRLENASELGLVEKYYEKDIRLQV